MPNDVVLRRLWAKTDKATGATHPLICHMIDVGQVTRALWDQALHDQTRQQFSRWLGMDQSRTRDCLAFWASLHDLGKAAPGFQRKYAPAVPVLEQAGLRFPPISTDPAPHGVMTAWALRSILPELFGAAKRDAIVVSQALGGHHGSWPTPDRFLPSSLKSSDKGDSAWEQYRRELVWELYANFGSPQQGVLPGTQDERNAFLVLFSGMVSVADWLGSMQDLFPCTPAYASLDEYTRHSCDQAATALAETHWGSWQPVGKPVSFAAMFPFPPNDIQQAVLDVSERLTQPALLILEAPTGMGKTEAALYLADCWLQGNKGPGIYIAMPTQATSNQMYDRFTKALLSRYPEERLNIHLVHGAALLAEPPPRININNNEDAAENQVEAAAWFLPRKRTLLAPFGVGTVDQTLLSVLQTRHFFVRMFGLGNKVVIFDEVHAYDTYMSALFQRLLAWLHQIGTSVILLSATLPETTRKQLVSAWIGKEPDNLTETPYPRLTVASEGKASPVHLPGPISHQIEIEKIRSDPQSVVQALRKALSDAGNAAVICNRVRRAQEVYQAVREANLVEPENLILFHARFPFAWRDEVEKKVLKLYGKNGDRPNRSVVVATQVIEQSLDLDFDYLVTDLAPIDLLVQRAGRLHRHPGNDAGRPRGLQTRKMAICIPIDDKTVPSFGSDERVYERAVLLRTWKLLRKASLLSLPQDTDELIEAVYGEGSRCGEDILGYSEAIHIADIKAERDKSNAVQMAEQRLVPLPGDESLIFARNENLQEEDHRVNEAFRALTRLSEPGIALVCLFQVPGGLSCEPNGPSICGILDPDPALPLIRELLRHSLSVQNWQLVTYFNLRGIRPWSDTAHLRNHFLVEFDKRGIARPSGAPFLLRLSRELGLEILKEAT